MYNLLAVSSEVKETLNVLQDRMYAAFLWATVAVIGLLLVGTLVVWLGRKEYLPRYGRVAVPLAVGFALAIAVSGFSLNLIKYSIRGALIPTMYIPIAATVGVAILGGFVYYLVNTVAPSARRIAFWIVAGLTVVPFVVSIVYLSLYFRDEIAEGGYYVDVSTLALVLSSVALVILAVLVAVFCGHKEDKSEHTRSVAYAGVSVALAFALSYIKLFSMPQGGSITLASMLPIMLYSCRYGTRKGLLVGLVYGLLQAVQDPYVIHPAQFLLDYPLAFAMLGLAGWAAEVPVLGRHRAVALLVGCISAFFLRYVAHVLSGIFAFAAYAHDAGAASVAAYSFAYNSYVLVDGAMCLVLGILMYLNKGARRLLFGEARRAAASASDAGDTATDVAEADAAGVDAAEEPDAAIPAEGETWDAIPTNND